MNWNEHFYRTILPKAISETQDKFLHVWNLGKKVKQTYVIMRDIIRPPKD